MAQKIRFTVLADFKTYRKLQYREKIFGEFQASLAFPDK